MNMDITIDVNLKQSEINGLFNEVEELKRQRAHLKDAMDKKTDKIINHILKHGNVLAYKGNEAHVLTVKNGVSKKFDKAALATDVGRTQSELNIVGVAEIVEEQKVTSEDLKKYFYDEPKQTLKARKAKKTDIELLTRGGSGQ